ncbi:ATP-dependent zinc protease [Candidatus Saccharibacteria bacterium]|nr:ATP-dependent zinc protease [Candidatus Saccharibacteria bacterium]
MKNDKVLPVIGSTEYVEIAGIKDIPAKIDTGADSSSVWASHIRVTKEGVLRFRLFDKDSPFYTGKVFSRKDFKVAVVRSSSGHEQIRYRTHLGIMIGGRKIKVLFNLSDRSKNNFPVLIGRRTISNKFIIDVSRNHTDIRPKSPKTKIVQKRFAEDPYEFHRKYIEKLSGNVDNIKLKKKGV